MGKCDAVQRIFWEDNARFADLVNTVLGEGECFIHPEDIGDEESGLPIGKGKLSSVFQRDVIRKVTKDVTCFLVGIENQQHIHYAMPARVMLWDALVYARQLRGIRRKHAENGDIQSKDEILSGIKKDERLRPVCSIVLYYGEKIWDGPKELHDVLNLTNIPKKFWGYFANYPMHLIDVHRFPDWDRFQTDLREVFGFINNSQNKDDMKKFLAENAERLSLMSDDACELIESVTGTKKIKRFRKKKEAEENMCKAIDDMLKESWDEGFEKGQKIAKEKAEAAEAERKKAEAERKKAEEERKKAEVGRKKAEAEKKKAKERIRYLEAEVKRLKRETKTA